jgi:hypothetical protein
MESTRSDIMAGIPTKTGVNAKTPKLQQHQLHIWLIRIGKNWSQNRLMSKNAD